MATQKIAIPATLSRSRGAAPDGSYRWDFRPNGRPAVRKNSRLLTPNWRTTEAPWAARLFVGFSVGDKPVYDMDDLITVVKAVRQRQGAPLDSTFVYQRGVYTHESDNQVVTEDGAQVILLNLDGTSKDVFEAQMIELANIIVDEMQQEAVIIEMQQGGVVREIIGVTKTDTEMDVEDDSDEDEGHSLAAARVLAAFDKLDAETGNRNHVTLLDMRRAVPELSREQFDRAINELRRDWILTLSPAEGRHRRVPKEVLDAGIQEETMLMVYASRRD